MRGRQRVLAVLLEAFNVRPGEGVPILLLLLHSLFLGVFVGFYFTVANAAFLSQLDLSAIAHLLPYAYLASGVVAYLAVSAFSWLRSRVSFATLLAADLLFVCAVVVLFAVAVATGDSPWVSAAMYVAVIPMLTLLDLEFWGLTGRLFDLQQGKRLFALVGSGEVLAAALSFFAVPVLRREGAGPVSLLLVAAVGVLLSLALLPVIFRRCGKSLEGGAEAGREERRSALADLLRNRYFVTLSVVTLLFIVCQYFIDFSFLIELRTQVTDEKALIQFLGVFFGIAKVTELLFKTILFSRVTTQLGLLVGLLILPGSLLVPVVLAAVQGVVSGPRGVMVFLVLAKLLEFTLRKAVFEPSFRILYQPLEREERLRLQTRVEGLVRQVGLLGAGVLLVLIGLARAAGRGSVIQVLVLVLLAWIAATVLLHREYRSRLLEVLSRRSERGVVQSPSEVILERLRTASGPEAMTVLDVLRRVEPGLLEQAADVLLEHGEAAVRRDALERIAVWRLVGLTEAVERAAGRDPDREVAAAAAVALEVLRQVEVVARSPARIAALAASDEVEDRRLAATAVARSRDAPPEVLLRLVADADPVVRRRALLAAGAAGRSELHPRLVEELCAGEACKAAAAALAQVGPEALRPLQVAFRRLAAQPQLEARIVRVWGQIPGPDAEALLLGVIDHRQWLVQHQALTSLSVRRFRAHDEGLAVIKRKVEETVDRITWYLAVQRDLGLHEGCADLGQALEWRIGRDRETIYLLLSLICDAQAVLLIRDGLAREGAEGRAYALEIASEVIPPDLKGLVAPLLEQLPPGQTLERLDFACPQRSMDLLARLGDVVSQGVTRVDVWTRACGLHALGLLGEPPLPPELVAHLYNPDPLVREVAAWAAHRIDPDACARGLAWLGEAERREVEAVLGDNGRRRLTRFEKVLILRRTEAMSVVPGAILASVAADVAERAFGAGEHICDQGDPGQSMFAIAAGRVAIEVGGRVVRHLGPGEVLGEIAVLTGGRRSATAIAAEPTRLVEVDQDWAASLLADHMEVLPTLIHTITRRLVGAG